MQHLYRHFDKDGKLLYVGVSLTVMNRLAQHRDASHWFPEITKVTLEQHPTREAVLAAERKAIAEESPLHNLQRPKPVEVEQAQNLAEESRTDLVRRIAQFNPMYSVADVAAVLGMSVNKVKAMISEGLIGHVCIGEKSHRLGVYKIYRITGWQLIEHIEHMERQSKAYKRKMSQMVSHENA